MLVFAKLRRKKCAVIRHHSNNFCIVSFVICCVHYISINTNNRVDDSPFKYEKFYRPTWSCCTCCKYGIGCAEILRGSCGLVVINAARGTWQLLILILSVKFIWPM